jgi:hypothetical protein
MAAHALTFLKDISEHTYTLDSIKFALGHCQAGDQLDFNDWTVLYNSESFSNVQEIATKLIRKYAALHCFLKFPATAEEWTRTWLELAKHRKSKKYQEYLSLHFAKVQL